MSIEKKLDIPFISALALREKQIQQNYRPIIAVHKSGLRGGRERFFADCFSRSL
jgi:hypothetical protein